MKIGTERIREIDRQIADLSDADFEIFARTFVSQYDHTYRGVLSSFDAFGDEWSFLAMETIRGVGRLDQKEALRETLQAPIDTQIAFLESSNREHADKGILALFLLRQILDARLDPTPPEGLVSLLRKIADRSASLNLPPFEPPNWGSIDWRGFHNPALDPGVEFFPPDKDGEDMRIDMHLKHIVSIMAGGIQSEKSIVARYENAGWQRESAQRLVSNAGMLQIIGNIRTHDYSTAAARRLVLGENPCDTEDESWSEEDISRLDRAVWPAEFHEAAKYSAPERRGLRSLAFALRAAFDQGVDRSTLASRLVDAGLNADGAATFVDVVEKFDEMLRRGIDLTPLEKFDIIDLCRRTESGLDGEARESAVNELLDGTLSTKLDSGDRGLVLYLRAFKGDEGLVGTSGFWGRLFGGGEGHTYEQVVLDPLLRRRGLPFGLMSLEEKTDPEGTDRFRAVPRVQCSNEHWREDVAGAILSSSLTFIRFDRTPGLSWEIERAISTATPERLLFGLPDHTMLEGGENEALEIVDEFKRLTVPHLPGDLVWAGEGPAAWSDVHFVGFSPAWQPLLFRTAGSGAPAERIRSSLSKALDHLNKIG